jgi:hypothetical protein
MPQRTSPLLGARRGGSRWDDWDDAPCTDHVPPKRSLRLAATVAFVATGALGAALSAVAGDTVATYVEEAPTGISADAPPEPAGDGAPIGEAPPPEASAEPVPSEAPNPAPPPADPLAEPEIVSELAPPADAPAAEASAPPDLPAADASAPPAGSDAAPAAAQPSARTSPAVRSKRGHNARGRAKVRRRVRAERLMHARTRPPQGASVLEPEASVPGVDATVWLHRSLPDPTPPSKRLSRSFARQLRTQSRLFKADWAFVLGVLRARGRTGAAPATPAELRQLATRLGGVSEEDEREAARAIDGRDEFADRAAALARYHRAVGLPSLVRGLEWAKPRLETKLLRDDRVGTYDGGRSDIHAGLVDVRVLVLMAYLAETYDEVTVSSLKSGHRLYSRPGVVSAHVYGLAVDVSALGGEPIAGNQEPGGLTEDAVRNILLLPPELMPRQVISLLGLGGPSFPLGDHGDHIHVGY